MSPIAEVFRENGQSRIGPWIPEQGRKLWPGSSVRIDVSNSETGEDNLAVISLEPPVSDFSDTVSD